MNNLKNLLAAFHSDEDGATATEYLILLILIACAVIFMVTTFGKSVSAKFKESSDTVDGLTINTGAGPGG